MEKKTPLVSIYCLTYNHENYIRDCLEGFVNQRTNFPFEVIVHDDASQDKTQEIIKEYEKKYPHIIKAVYQKENQVSKKAPIISRHILPKVSGKYVAICEGDDYWTDVDKLQLQFSAMEANADCHFCVCGVQEVSVNKKPLGVLHPRGKLQSGIIHSNDFIKMAGTYSFQTSSYFVRYDDWKEFVLNPPEFRRVSDIGDLPMLLYYGSLGNVVYIDRVMSCYRRGAPSSYSAKKNKWTIEKRITHFDSQIKVWSIFDSYSKNRYHAQCVIKISQNMFGYLILQKRANEFLVMNKREYFYALPLAKKVYILIGCILRRIIKNHYLKSMIRNERRELELWESQL